MGLIHHHGLLTKNKGLDFISHRYNADAVTVYDDGTNDWATTIHDQIGGKNASQSTQAYRLKLSNGGLTNEKSAGSLTFYNVSNITLSPTNGWAIFIVVDVYSILSGVQYINFATSGVTGLFAQSPDGGTGPGGFFSGNRDALIAEIPSPRAVICFTQSKIYMASFVHNFAQTRGFTFAQIFGRNASSSGLYLAMRGTYYQYDIVVDRTLSESEIDKHMNYLRSLYNAT